MLHAMGLPPSIIPWGTNSCSLPPCSSMHHCQACQDTTTPQLRQAGKAKVPGKNEKLEHLGFST